MQRGSGAGCLVSAWFNIREKWLSPALEWVPEVPWLLEADSPVEEQNKCPIRQHVRTSLLWFWVYSLDLATLSTPAPQPASHQQINCVIPPPSLFLQSGYTMILTLGVVVFDDHLWVGCSEYNSVRMHVQWARAVLTRAHGASALPNTKQKVSWTVFTSPCTGKMMVFKRSRNEWWLFTEASSPLNWKQGRKVGEGSSCPSTGVGWPTWHHLLWD